jgi:hypothetical protein
LLLKFVDLKGTSAEYPRVSLTPSHRRSQSR